LHQLRAEVCVTVSGARGFSERALLAPLPLPAPLLPLLPGMCTAPRATRTSDCGTCGETAGSPLATTRSCTAAATLAIVSAGNARKKRSWRR
jgi:hypothetical protein